MTLSPTSPKSPISKNVLNHAHHSSPISCYHPRQIRQLEAAWFAHSDAFGLMMQAAWQVAHWLINHISLAGSRVLVAVGSGNNGGDGWLVAAYLLNLTAAMASPCQVVVVQTGEPSSPQAKRAKQAFIEQANQTADLTNRHWWYSCDWRAWQQQGMDWLDCDIIVDAIFGIGLNRIPQAEAAWLITFINQQKHRQPSCQVISLDVPSGLNAADGAVYQAHLADRPTVVQADFTLCLLARKLGLQLGRGKAYSGQVVDLPLLPVTLPPQGYYHHKPLPLPKRSPIGHKGTFGHGLIIGGHQTAGGHGMAGAALLAGAACFAMGAGKVTVACHTNFHAAIVAGLPNAMTADWQNQSAMKALIEVADVVAIGMGLGREADSRQLFLGYLSHAIDQQKPMIIDADGLYHLAKLDAITLPDNAYCTPHNGEAARLLGWTIEQVEADKITAIYQLQQRFGGVWLIKGETTLVLEGGLQLCGLGNAGMATAGMGDVLAGMVAGILAQQPLRCLPQPLLTAVLLHAQAGDVLAAQVGMFGLQALDMPHAIRQVLTKQAL